MPPSPRPAAAPQPGLRHGAGAPITHTCSCSKGIEFLRVNASLQAVPCGRHFLQLSVIRFTGMQAHSSHCMRYNPCRTFMPVNGEVLIFLAVFLRGATDIKIQCFNPNRCSNVMQR